MAINIEDNMRRKMIMGFNSKRRNTIHAVGIFQHSPINVSFAFTFYSLPLVLVLNQFRKTSVSKNER